MAAKAGDDHNLRNIPVNKAFGNMGDCEYSQNTNQNTNSVFSMFMVKPDSQCSDSNIWSKIQMAMDNTADMSNMRQIPMTKTFGLIGKVEYRENPYINDVSNKFMMKYDSK